MKSLATLTICSSAIVLAGCASDIPPDRATFNEDMLNYHAAESVDAAIVRQQAIYPYHFLVNSSELNTLGARDVAVLAAHYRAHPGTLSVARGGSSDELYEARVEAIRIALAEAGVSLGRMTIADGLPGGDGTTSSRVVEIQDRASGESMDLQSGRAGRESF